LKVEGKKEGKRNGSGVTMDLFREKRKRQKGGTGRKKKKKKKESLNAL